MDFLFAGTKKSGHCREVALVEVQLYNIANCGCRGFFIIIHFCFFGALSPSGIGEACPVKENQPQKFVPAT